MLQAIDHVQLAMPTGAEAVARAFYVDLLGLTEIPKPVPLQKRGGCWFAQGAVVIHLGVEADFRPARKAHPAFQVTDLAALAMRLQAGDVAITWDDALLPAVRRFYAADFFGNRLEFLCPTQPLG
jgi:catechol 2,3-dioxygenase-like lactoylglutathione lyase family enzyme